MNTKNISIGALVAVAVVFGVLAFKNPSVIAVPTELKLDASSFGSKAPVVNVPAPIVNVAAPQVSVNVPKSDAPKFGSVTGPDLPSPYFQYGGVRTWQYKTSMARNASTTCSIQSPVSTSTLIFASANFTAVASTTVFDIGYSAVSAFATTTIILSQPITAATPTTLIATSSAGLLLSGLSPAGALVPNAFINFKIGGGSVLGTIDPVGQCIAIFREVQ